MTRRGAAGKPATLATLRLDVQGGAACVQVLAHLIHDAKYEYLRARTREEQAWLLGVLVDRLEEEADELARHVRRLLAGLKGSAPTTEGRA